MPTADQLKALVKAHYEGPNERFTTLALQIAAHEAHLGHTNLAEGLKSIIDRAKKSQAKLKPLSPELEGLVLQVEPIHRLHNLVVAEELQSRIERVLFEFIQRDKLRHYALDNRRKLLLAGPPGTGKTLTASVLASELQMPLFVVMVDKVVNRYLGETTARLRQVFELIRERQGVYLFDEFDAIGGERGKDNDVGEMRRVLNGFLQFIEHDTSDSVIIAATNNLNLLDQALFRRFDDVLVYDYPNDEQIRDLIENTLGAFRGKEKLESVIEAARGMCHAEIVLCCLDSMKDAILRDLKLVRNEALSRILKLRKNSLSSLKN